MTPQAPSPKDIASAQSGANIDSAIASSYLNNIDQSSPFGTIDFTQNGYTSYKDSSGKTVKIPNFSSKTTLSPDQQALYDRSVKAGKNIGDLAVSQSSKLNSLLSSPMNTNGLPAAPGQVNLQDNIGPADYSTDRARVEQALLSRTSPEFDRRQAATETKLINQGVTPGSEAWKAELDQLGRDRNDATMQAILAGGSEQSRLAGLEMDRGGFNNAAKLQEQGANIGVRNNALQERFALRNQPINEITALLSGSQVTAPTFSAPYTQGVGSVPVGQYMQDDYRNQLNQYNSNMSGLFGLGSTLASGLFALSDRRAKKNIRRIGTTNDGQNIYRYEYKGSDVPQVGLMAQEVLQRHPEAVAMRPDGLLAVDYAEALKEAA